MYIMDKLKEKLKNSTLTRAELNAAQPKDDSTLEWKAWNDLRIAMNDRTASLTEVHGMRLTAIEKMLLKHITETEEKFAGLELNQKRVSDNVDESMKRIEKLMTNHLPHIMADIDLIKGKLEL